MIKPLTAALLLAGTASAIAQPADPPPLDDQPAAGAPMPPPEEVPPPPPQPPQPPQPPPPPVYVVPTPAPPTVRRGVTFEANIGLGILRVSRDGDSDSENGLGGLNLGIGVFVNPRMAISLRVAGVTYFENDVSLTQAFIGPSLQYFVNDNLFVGGGLGIGTVRIANDNDSASENDLGLDLRIGYSFNPGARHSFNASLEVTPTDIDGFTWTGIGILLGYQLQ